MAEHIILTEIAAIREAKIDDISAERLAGECGACVVRDAKDLKASLEKSSGAIVIMGAADMDWVRKVLTEG